MATAPLTYSAHARALLVLGLPLVGTSVAAFAIHMTDTLMLGWYSVTALAAATIASSFWFITFIVGAGFGRAVVPLVAAAVAEGDETTARRVTRMALWLSLGFACLAVALLWWSEALFLAIGQTPSVAAEAQTYLRIAVFGMFPALLGNVIRSYLAAQGLTAVQLWISLVALVMNGLVNYALIFGNWGAPELGIQGAAIASVLIQTLQTIVLCLYADRKLPEVRLFQRIWKSDRDALATVFRLGLPIGLTALAEGSLFAASAVMMGWIGELQLAAHGIAIQLAGFTFMFHVGMSEAATVRAGRAYGRRDRGELAMLGRTAYVVGLGFSVLVVLIFVSMPGTLIGMFIDPAEPQRAELIAVGIGLILVAALFQFVDAGQIIALSLLRGVQDTNVPMWMAIASYWAVGMPAGYVMGFVLGWGGVGIWMGLTVGLAAATALLGWRFWGRSVNRAAIPRPVAVCPVLGLVVGLVGGAGQALGLFAHQNLPQIVHRQQQGIGHAFQLLIGGVGLNPLGSDVEIVDGAVDIVHFAEGQQRQTFCQPALDFGRVVIRQHPVALRLDGAVAGVDDGDVLHLDPALPVLGIHPVDGGAVFADAEVVGGKVCAHLFLLNLCPLSSSRGDAWLWASLCYGPVFAMGQSFPVRAKICTGPGRGPP